MPSDDFLHQQQKYFNEVASHQKDDGFFCENNATKTEYNAILSLMPDLKDKTVLDMGCGTGRYALRIAKYARQVIGIDISDKSINFANQTAKNYNVNNFTGIVFDHNLHLQENYFDYILMVNVIHHVDDIDSMLDNLYRSLKPDGSLIIFEFNPLNLLFVPFLVIIGQIKSHLNKLYFRSSAFTLRKILKNNNYDVELFKRYAFFPTMLYNFSIIFEKVNMALNKIPIINNFSAFHIFKCRKNNTNE
ncbi:MAG: class I SAM-dependent methyltransferase [Patescibacteria group bacterium]|jgi:ubiquinone/menaquinone biosynthesis C-methylase UbiE